MTDDPQPTAQDVANAELRAEVAARMQAAYDEVLAWAESAFGPGWVPSCKHSLIDKIEEAAARAEQRSPTAAAVVFTVRNDAGERRHFTVVNGQVQEHPTWEAGFGDMLLEPHPTMRIEVRGEMVAPHYYSLCFAPFELYQPKSPEALAKLRESRERGKQERADRKWAEENPLIVLMERAQQEGDRER